MFFAAGVGIERSFIFQGPRAMGESLDEECSASLLNDLCKQWWIDQNLRHRLWNDSAVLVLAAEGEKTVQPSQQCCLMNAGFLGPILKRMRGARTLKLPGVDVISSELLNLWCKHFRSQDQKRQGKGRLPNLQADFVIPDAVQAQCHLDAKTLKTLLSCILKQFKSDRVAKEAYLQYHEHRLTTGVCSKPPIPRGAPQDPEYHNLVMMLGSKACGRLQRA